MFEAGLFSLLTNDPGIRAQVGGSPFARKDDTAGVWPVQAPEGSPLPYLVYSIAGGSNVTSTAGTNALGSKRVQVNCYGRHYEDVKDLKGSVMACLLSFRGSLSDGSVMNGALLVSETDAFAEGPFLFCAVVDFNVWVINRELYT